MCVCVRVRVCVCVCMIDISIQQEPKWKVSLKCALQLIVGVGLVTLFSDPMVDALTDLTDTSHKGRNGSHIPIGSKPPSDSSVTT